MSTASSLPVTNTRPNMAQLVGPAITGAVAGVIGSMMMAAYAMIASATYQHHGFFTPLYHIASLFVAPTALMTSMQHAMMGSTFYFSAGPAILGAVIHMMTGALYGMMLGVAVAVLRLRGMTLISTGLVWGAVVFALSTWVFLPLMASIFSSGDQITHMAKMVGYSTFLVEHLIFGMTAGVLLTMRRPAVQA